MSATTHSQPQSWNQPQPPLTESRTVLLASLFNLQLPGVSLSLPTNALIAPSPIHGTFIPLSSFTPVPATPSPPPVSTNTVYSHSYGSPTTDTKHDSIDSKEDEIFEITAYHPAQFIEDYLRAYHQPFTVSALTLSSLTAIVMERLCEPRAWVYLAGCWSRVNQQRHSHSDQSLLSLAQSIIVDHATILLQHDELLPPSLPTGPRQLITWMSAHCDLPPSMLDTLLVAVVDAMPPLQIPVLAKALFGYVQSDMREQTLINPDHSRSLTVLCHLLELPTLARAFVTLPNFIFPLFNGYKIESDSPLGQFLRLTTLPDEPSVGDKYFSAPLHMTDVERLFCMGRLNRKLDKSQELLGQAWTLLLMRDNYTRTALLTWISTMLLANWGRTRMRSQRKSTSNDGFLLNIASVMLRIAELLSLLSPTLQQQQSQSSPPSHLLSTHLIDPFYCLLPSRLDVKDETKICATTSDETAWLKDFYFHAKKLKASQSLDASVSTHMDTISASGTVSGAVSDDDSKEEKGIGGDDNSMNALSTPSQSPTFQSQSQTQSVDSSSKFKRARLSLGGPRSSAGSIDDMPPSLSLTTVSESSPLLRSNTNSSSQHSFSTPPSPSLSSSQSQASTSSVLRVGDLSFSTSVERDYMSDSLSTHYGIVCDKCRSRDLAGVRYKCFLESDTRILTDSGFLFLEEIEALIESGESVKYACYDRDARSIGYHSGRLFFPDTPNPIIVNLTISDKDNASDVSLRVTSDHRMFGQFGFINDGSAPAVPPSPSVHEAYELFVHCQCTSTDDCHCGNRTFRMVAVAENGVADVAYDRSASGWCDQLKEQFRLVNHSAFEAFLELYGFWLASTTHSTADSDGMIFPANSTADCGYLLDRFQRCGFVENEDFTIDQPLPDSGTFHLHHDRWQLLDPRSVQRSLPSWVQQLSCTEARLLIRGLSRCHRSIHTASMALRDQLLQLLLHAGYTARAQSMDTTDQWRVTWGDSNSDCADQCWPQLVLTTDVTAETYDSIQDGRQWCVTVDHPHHLIIAQRAHRTAPGTVTALSRPLVVGQCAQCKDYDLCAQCERRDFEESLGLVESAGATFQCPYLHCEHMQSLFNEQRLRDHVHDFHSNDLSLVTCPICALHNSTSAVMTQPRFDQHLARDHCSDHDAVNHQMMKIHTMIPLMHKKFFRQQPSHSVKQFDQPLINSTIKQYGDSARPSLVASAVQSQTVHELARCFHCDVSPIIGIAYRCSQCHDTWLCAQCESLGYRIHGHQPSHIFLQFRRPLLSAQSVTSERMQYPSAVLGSFGFSLHTEWFFLTLHTLHVGMMKTCSRYTSLVQSIEQESDARKLDSFMKVKLCVDAQLLHPRLLRDTLALYVTVARWLASVIDPAHRGDSITLPLSSTIPMEFAALPEYLIEDMADFMLFLSRFSIETMDSIDVMPILHLFVALISATPYLNNPYLRAKLVEVFCGVSEHPTSHGPGCPALSSRLVTDTFVIQHLIPSLIRLYVDIEHTGSDSQFYDKFNVRHAISVLMKFLADYLPFVVRLETEALDTELFVRFTNSIINDMIYLLDEALIKATQLHEIQTTIASTRTGGISFTQMQARRQEQERAAQISRSLRTAAVLATHTINLLFVLCLHGNTAAVLLRPEMVDRITASINTYVVKIAGPKRDSILVKDSSLASYHCDSWLNVFADIYLQFRSNDAFRLSIVKDSRCFLAHDFKRAVEILREKKLKSSDRLSDFFALIESLEVLSDQVQNDWDELGDVPEEFLDPILNTLMEDPVILPSGVAMDRAVITRHLLNKRLDPFNRQPLDVKDLLEATELKRKIQDWKASVQAKRQASGSSTVTDSNDEKHDVEMTPAHIGITDGVSSDVSSAPLYPHSHSHSHPSSVSESGKRKLLDDNAVLTSNQSRSVSSNNAGSLLSSPVSLSSSSSMSALSSAAQHPAHPHTLSIALTPVNVNVSADSGVWISSASSSSWQSQQVGSSTEPSAAIAAFAPNLNESSPLAQSPSSSPSVSPPPIINSSRISSSVNHMRTDE